MRNVTHVDVHDKALEHFGLKRDPFNWLPEKVADYFYGTQMALVDIALWKAIHLPGICAVIGEVGGGKSSAVRRFIEKELMADKRYVVSHIDVPHLRKLDTSHICRKVLFDLTGNTTMFTSLIQVAEDLRTTIEDLAQEGIRPVLVAEDAHLLSVQTLSELKLLYELRKGIKHQLAIVLVGQPQLHTKLMREDLRQLAARTAVHRMAGLKGELEQYLSHRFKHVRADLGDLFDKAALQELRAHAGVNTPLEVAAVCARALNFAYTQGEKRITRELMVEVLSAHEEEGSASQVEARVTADAVAAATDVSDRARGRKVA